MLDLRSWVYALHYITKLLTLTVPGRRVDDYVALAGENTMLLLTLVHVLKEVSGYQMTGDVPFESQDGWGVHSICRLKLKPYITRDKEQSSRATAPICCNWCF